MRTTTWLEQTSVTWKQPASQISHSFYSFLSLYCHLPILILQIRCIGLCDIDFSLLAIYHLKKIVINGDESSKFVNG